MTDIKTEIELKDERRIQIPVKLDSDGTKQFANFVAQSYRDGYTLKSATAITHEEGHPMDPYTVTDGIKLTFERTGPAPPVYREGKRELKDSEERCSYCRGTKESPNMMSDDSYSQFKCPYPFHWKDN